MAEDEHGTAVSKVWHMEAVGWGEMAEAWGEERRPGRKVEWAETSRYRVKFMGVGKEISSR